MNAITLYKVARYFHSKNIPFIPKLIERVIFLIFNSVVPVTASIGQGTKFAYGGIGCVIHYKTVIGKNVIIGQGITIGRKLDPEGVPVIGDDVYISAGSRILGGITIGNNVIIGANSVVLHDVPDNTIVAGTPAKVIRKDIDDIYKLLKNIN